MEKGKIQMQTDRAPMREKEVGLLPFRTDMGRPRRAGLRSDPIHPHHSGPKPSRDPSHSSSASGDPSQTPSRPATQRDRPPRHASSLRSSSIASHRTPLCDARDPWLPFLVGVARGGKRAEGESAGVAGARRRR
jgi:hypothetical protein